jgi:general L-amino acid transport system permease protein
VTSTTGYAFAAIFYLIFCYGMSRYARMIEVRLAVGDQR